MAGIDLALAHDDRIDLQPQELRREGPFGGGEASDTLRAPSGRLVRLEADAGREELIVCNAAGQVELRVRLTDQGPVLTLSGARIELDADTIALRCRELEIDAQQKARIEAASVDVEAKLGGITLRANDDVEVEGERIWLNR
jgi:hypothetical protein